VRKSRIVSVVFVTICALVVGVPACVTENESSITSKAEGYDYLSLGSGDVCGPPEEAQSTSSGSGSGSGMPTPTEPPPGDGSGSSEPPPSEPPPPGDGSGDYGGYDYGGYARANHAGPSLEDLEMLEDGTYVFAGGPAANEGACASACGALGCAGYTWNGSITTGCKCFLNTGWKWCWSSSCNPATLAAGSARCTATTCP
jgi:hypothetical protein